MKAAFSIGKFNGSASFDRCSFDGVDAAVRVDEFGPDGKMIMHETKLTVCDSERPATREKRGAEGLLTRSKLSFDLLNSAADLWGKMS